jgi:aryl-alcohol dehydrogenase-like predicted oxidoreductase
METKMRSEYRGPARELGRSGIEISAMGFGCWAIGGKAWRGETPVGWGDVDDEESVRAIHRAIDLGVTFFDTADVYGTGHSERVLGRALAGMRERVVIATKFGNGYDESRQQIAGVFASPDFIQQACERSLQRLNTDVIDLYQFHVGNYPLEEVPGILDTLEGLVQKGSIRAYGWSTDDPIRARAFAEGQHCAAVQMQLNVLDDNPEMVALCEELNLAGINRGPLAMGLLTGKFSSAQSAAALGPDDVRGTRSPEWMKYFQNGMPNPEFVAKIEAIREVLTQGGRTLAQGALGWLWGRSPHMVPIPGFRTVKQVEENAAALRFGPLTPTQMAEIEAIRAAM